MKISKLLIIAILSFAFAGSAALASNAQIGGMINKAKSKVKDAEKKTTPTPKTENKNSKNNQTQTKSDDEESDARAENAENLAKAAGMPKALNTDASLNKLLFQSADDTRLIPRRVVVVDKDWLITIGARSEKVRRIFAVIGRTLDDGSGKCGKQMVQFDQSWKEDKNAWGLIYVQNIGEITPIACSAIGK
jgi:Sec-independent protein translocase protein TatA